MAAPPQPGRAGSHSLLYKLLVVGDYAAGKTSIIRRYCSGEFSSNYRITIGVDFSLKQLTWDSDTSVSLQLWDIAGHERFGAMTRIYYRFAIGAVVVFDVSRPPTLDSVKKWRDDINDKVVLPNGQPIPMILLANKCDLPDVQLNREKMDQFAKENGFVAWFETSAKANTNIDRAFEFLVADIFRVTKNLTIPSPGTGQHLASSSSPSSASTPNLSPSSSSSSIELSPARTASSLEGSEEPADGAKKCC